MDAISLRRKKRCDIMLEEPRSFFLVNEKLKHSVPTRWPEDYTTLVEQGDLLGFLLPDDHGPIVRIVRGPLNEREEEEYIGVAERPFSIAEGRFALSCGDAYLSADDPEGFFIEFQVPPGEYWIRVFTHLTAEDGYRRMPRPKDWIGFADWYRASRKRRNAPGWFCALAQDRDIEDGFLDPDGEVDLGFEEYEEDLVEYVVQLIPADEVVDGVASPLDDRGLLISSWRIPERCPRGLVPKNTIDIEDFAYSIEEEEVDPWSQFTKDWPHLEFMLPLAQAFANGDWDQAESMCLSDALPANFFRNSMPEEASRSVRDDVRPHCATESKTWDVLSKQWSFAGANQCYIDEQILASGRICDVVFLDYPGVTLTFVLVSRDPVSEQADGYAAVRVRHRYAT